MFDSLSENITLDTFQIRLFEKARENNRRILLPEANDDRILMAALECQADGLARIVLMGDSERINHDLLALNHGKQHNIELIDSNSIDQEKYREAFFETKGKDKYSPDLVNKLLKHPAYLSMLMLMKGEVDGVVAGATYTTAEVLKPTFSLLRSNPAIPASSIFFMGFADGVKVFGDCAVNINPSAKELAGICLESAKTAEQLGFLPIVAFVSYATGNSAGGDDINKIREALEIVKAEKPDLLVDGPLQYDAAVSPKIGAMKLPNSPVAGRANVLIFPNLSTGNTVYKAVQNAGGIVSIGPVLQGISKPVNDLSRGADVADIICTIAVTSILNDVR